MIDHQRCRAIVKLAAKDIKSYATKRWLLDDERGVFEKDAATLLEITSDRATALGLTATQVDNEIATHLAYRALTAMLTHAERNKRVKK